MKYGKNYVIKNQIKDNKDVTFLTVALLASIVVLYFFAGPAYGNAKDLQQLNETKRADLKGKEDLFRNMEKFNTENAKLGVNSKKLEAFVANRNNFQEYLDVITDLAVKRNLEVSSIGIAAKEEVSAVQVQAEDAEASAAAPSSGKKTFPLQEQGVKIAVEGDFENILDFARDLENGIPFVQEGSLELAAVEEGLTPQPGEDAGEGIGPVLTATMEFKFNYY